MKIKTLILNCLILNCLTVLLNIYIILYIKKFVILDKQQPIDYVLKEGFENSYLTIHNIISINNSLEFSKINNSNYINIKYVKPMNNFHTYITSYSKPFLIEMIHNSTRDCMCCN